MKAILISILSTLLLSYQAVATIVPSDSHINLDWFENISDEWNNGYPEERYHYVLDKIIEIYGPIIEKKGGTLHILRDWGDGSVNAWAWRIMDEYHLEVPGGMSRFHIINEEAFILTICHELGHLLGGAPARNKTISLEGQADYFATTHCAKRVLPQIAPHKKIEPTNEIKNLCSDQINQNICHRILAGSQSLANYFAWIARSDFPSLILESERQVSRTLISHPKAQCRLDTFKRGQFCKAIEDEVSFDDPKLGYCPNEFKIKRPACWFKD